ncbi:MAG: hypothetical protein H0V07_12025 [Propionibacteriales bacterium]|nr:hypothetical protein [Propionibacteriales bacterium]
MSARSGVVGASPGPHRADVELTAEREHPRRVVDVHTRDGQPDRRRRLPDQTGQRVGVDAGGGRGEPVGGPGSVKADQGVKVDHATQLVFRDLRVLHGGDVGQPGRRHSEGLGDKSAQGDGEPAPQIRGLPLPHHVRGVVVAVAAQRLPQHRVVLGVLKLAGRRPTMRT